MCWASPMFKSTTRTPMRMRHEIIGRSRESGHPRKDLSCILGINNVQIEHMRAEGDET